MKIAMVSEHASPLATLGGPDAGGQNVYVAQLSSALARRGHTVTVHTRRDTADQPERVPFDAGVDVKHVPVGPAEQVPKDTLYPYMPAFGSHLARHWAEDPPDVVHAHFWMSGIAALAGARALGIPVVMTYHALGTVKRRHQGDEDTSPAQRVDEERRIGQECSRVLATCSDEVFELADMGIPPERSGIVPCGVDTALFAPRPGHHKAPGRPRMLAAGRLVPRKGFDAMIRALAQLPDVELHLAGGPDRSLLAD
ncbi:glycosyltransferase, partial [Streptomyces sparsus]